MKKLFSYLLISSMVVLSSCTNYDDQFDDLNSQINSLKGQIEGFSSLSSGLTALQGTVASLQSAVANIPVTPATDISGLVSNQDALTAALSDLATQVTALQTSLASAATAAEVKALADSLATAQSDLTELLAQNNVFTGTLTINSASTLTAAESLGDKISIISGSVDIDQTSTAIDAARLQAVVSKITVVTADIDYMQSGTGVTAVNFDKLTGVSNIKLNQQAAISLPELVSAANVTLVENTKVLGFSAPKLETVTAFKGGTAGTTVDEISFPNATEVNLASLKYYNDTASAGLVIDVKSTATLDLSALATIDGTTLLQSALKLTTSGPKSITLPLFETGALTTDAEIVTLVKATTAPTFTGTSNIEELHMHNLQGALDVSTQTKLAILDVIGTIPATGTTASLTGARPTNVTVASADLETLTLAGSLGNVAITNAGSLTSVTTSGGIRSFSLTGATELTELTLGHGPVTASTLKRSDLIVVGATSLTKLVADSINNASILTLTGNTSLTSVSFAALKAVSTEASVVETVTIDDNALEAQSVQLPSAKDAVPVVAAAITSDSGLSTLEAYFAAAVAGTTPTVKVVFDNVVEAISAAGVKYNADADVVTSPSVTYATDKSVSINTAEDADWTLINVYPGSAAVTSDARYQTNTMLMNSVSQTFADTNAITFKGDADDIASTVTNDATFRAGISDYVTGNPDTWFPELTAALQAKVTSNGLNYTLTAAKDYGRKATYNFNTFTSTGISETQLISGTTRKLEFTGLGATLSATILTPTQLGLVQAMVAAINASSLTGTWVVSEQSGALQVYRAKVSGTTAYTDYAYTGAFPTISFSPWSTSLSNVQAIVASQTVRQTSKVEGSDWRMTAVNTDLTRNARNLENGGDFLTINAATTLSFTDIGANNSFATNSGTLQVNFANVKDVTTTTAAVTAGAVNYSTWL